MKEKATFHELQTKMNNFNLSFYQVTICSNMKKIKKSLFSVIGCNYLEYTMNIIKD